MVDETGPGPGASKNGALIKRDAIGWDPYEVWQARVRPHQHPIETPNADSRTPESAPPPGVRTSRYVNPQGAASTVSRKVRLLLGSQLHEPDPTEDSATSSSALP